MKKIIVIGGGPAGMMAAIKAAENGAAVVLLEKMDRLGRKMMITGKGRCNITNTADVPEMIRNIPGNGVFLNSVLRAFDNHEVMEFFAAQGVATKVERGGRVFPVSDKAADGHTIVPLEPALAPLELEEDWVKELSGLSLRHVEVRLLVNDKVKEQRFGEMLFTHFGVSGPIILTLSREAALALRHGDFVELGLNLKPALTPEQVENRLQRDFAQYRNRAIKNGLGDLLPARLIPPLLDLAYLPPDKSIHQITRRERQRLASLLQNVPLTVTRMRPLAEAIVTMGGVATREIDPKTMASKICPGLFIAGEVADVDAFTGGYNLQAAFSMGAAAGYWSACSD